MITMHAVKSRTCHRLLIILLALSAYAHAEAAHPATVTKPISIDKLASPVRSRILLGTASEGTEVEANMQDGQYSRIISEALNENGYTISDFKFDHGHLTRAHVVLAGYAGYPEVSRTNPATHKHFVVDPTDIVISNETYDFTTVASPCTNTDCVADKKDARKYAALYVRLMDTPPNPGQAEDEGNWECIHAAGQYCASFKQD